MVPTTNSALSSGNSPVLVRCGLISGLLISIVLASSAFTQGEDHPAFDIISSVQAGGGGSSAGGEFTLHGTIGQVATSSMGGGTFAINSGFWATAGDYCANIDTNCDGIIDGADLANVLGAWGNCTDQHCVADLNNDGHVNGIDLAILFANWD